jgi:hypothetical protein
MYIEPTRFDVDPYRCPCGAFTQRKYGPCGRCVAGDNWTRGTSRPGRVRHAVRRLFRTVAK